MKPLLDDASFDGAQKLEMISRIINSGNRAASRSLFRVKNILKCPRRSEQISGHLAGATLGIPAEMHQRMAGDEKARASLAEIIAYWWRNPNIGMSG